jgi:hypothetical protein
MKNETHTPTTDPFSPRQLRRYFAGAAAGGDSAADDSLSPWALRAEFSSALNQVPATDTTTRLNCSFTLRR